MKYIVFFIICIGLLSCLAKKEIVTYNDFDINKGFFLNKNILPDKGIKIKKRKDRITSIKILENNKKRRFKCRKNLYDDSPYIVEYKGTSNNPYVYGHNTRLGIYQYYHVYIFGKTYFAELTFEYITLISQQLDDLTISVAFKDKNTEGKYRIKGYKIEKKDLDLWQPKNLYFNPYEIKGEKLRERHITFQQDSVFVYDPFYDAGLEKPPYTSKFESSNKNTIFWLGFLGNYLGH
jgi:hypothetical protein